MGDFSCVQPHPDPSFRDVWCFQILSFWGIHGGFNLHFVGFSRDSHIAEWRKLKQNYILSKHFASPQILLDYFCISSSICFLLFYFFMAVLVGLERDRNKGTHPICRVDQKLTAVSEKTNPGECFSESMLRSLRLLDHTHSHVD